MVPEEKGSHLKSSFKNKKNKKIPASSKALPDFTSVMFVSQTHNGTLDKRLQKVENRISKLTGERIKIVERSGTSVKQSGTSVKQMLIKSKPWAGRPCGKDKCLSCLNSEEPQNCFAKGVVYDINCVKCKEMADEGEEIPVSKYTGQTSRSLYQRGKVLCSNYCS